MDDPSRDPPPLVTLQRWLQSVIVHPAGIERGILAPESQAEIPLRIEELESVILPSRALSAVDRLAIYGNAYFARLIGCLREQFPALHFMLGDEAFDAVAFAYLQEHPSTSYTLGHLARQFADYLEATRPPCDDSAADDSTDLVIDLARLEWTMDEVFDGPGEEEMESTIAARLAEIPSDAWPNVRLEVSQSLRLLELRFPLDTYYSAARAGRQHDMPMRGASCLVVWRRNYVVRRWEISREAFALLRELASGAVLATALERAAASCDDFPAFVARVPEWFREWGEAGLIVDVSC